MFVDHGRELYFATPLVKTNRFANSFIVKSAREALRVVALRVVAL